MCNCWCVTTFVGRISSDGLQLNLECIHKHQGKICMTYFCCSWLKSACRLTCGSSWGISSPQAITIILVILAGLRKWYLYCFLWDCEVKFERRLIPLEYIDFYVSSLKHCSFTMAHFVFSHEPYGYNVVINKMFSLTICSYFILFVTLRPSRFLYILQQPCAIYRVTYSYFTVHTVHKISTDTHSLTKLFLLLPFCNNYCCCYEVFVKLILH